MKMFDGHHWSRQDFIKIFGQGTENYVKSYMANMKQFPFVELLHIIINLRDFIIIILVRIITSAVRMIMY